MANHVKTVVQFKDLKSKDEANFILNMIATPFATAEDPITEWKINFNKIIPEPKTIEECPKEFIVTGSEHIAEYEDRPWFNWYDWHIQHWGTKWNAFDCYTDVQTHQITFVFSTAWSVAMPILLKLKMLGFNMFIRWADEDLGSNCGVIRYHKELGLWEVHNSDEIENPEEFAENLWDEY